MADEVREYTRLERMTVRCKVLPGTQFDPNARKPLGAYLQVLLHPRDGNSEPIEISVRVDTATDYTTLPISKLIKAGYTDDHCHVRMTINRGTAMEYQTALFRCHFEILVNGIPALPYPAHLDALVARAGESPPAKTRQSIWGWIKSAFGKGPAGKEKVESNNYDRPSSTGYRKSDTDDSATEPVGVISLADLCACFDIHFDRSQNRRDMVLVRRVPGKQAMPTRPHDSVSPSRE